MNSRQRVQAFLNREPLDRIPNYYRATGEVTQKLLNHFSTSDFNDIRRELSIDGWVDVQPAYQGPSLSPPSDCSREDYWGTRYKEIDYGTGVYEEKCHYPLADASTLQDLDAYPWPQVQWWDFEIVSEQVRQHSETAIGVPLYSLFEKFNDLKPIDECLMDMVANPEFVKELFQRLHDYWMAYLTRFFQAGGGEIDLMFISDDVGMQDRMMMRPEVWRQFFPPFYEQLTDLAHGFGVSVIYHSDGAIDPIIPDLIATGIDSLEPIQHVCPGMDREHLKKAYGDDVLFMGGVENQHILPFGTVQEVEQETRDCMRILGKGGGYMIASCHNIQPVTPVENILALYRVIREEGSLYL